ncbi:MAG: transcriptional regulator [Gammaproteobacteria bacterium CG11_big_fil_rev_8_21_14_0_20_46_22]|nr:MAG: transcriptional regulator [Gammaproteobacteria bacterium CG12_big_fil_rev_8_21_14_0_65_46_12]PIR11389.1 MAG: transcriptional regulator [Gammaproteobacteria bacterium CG11_big_fil_rev_8_21_14_0_20_46_22]
MTKRSTKWHDELKQSVLSDDEARTEYKAFKLQLELAETLKQSRQKADMTQDDIAEKMHTKKSVIARLEAAGGRGKHSPSLKTLSKYASALGFNLEIKLKRAR